MTNDRDKASGYRTGMTVGQVADEWLQSLILEEVAGTLNGESIYGVSNRFAVQLTLAGGGPGADITFVFAEGVTEENSFESVPEFAVLDYCDPSARAQAVAVGREADALWAAFNSPACYSDHAEDVRVKGSCDCRICGEAIMRDGNGWAHLDGDVYCGCGDGSTAQVNLIHVTARAVEAADSAGCHCGADVVAYAYCSCRWVGPPNYNHDESAAVMAAEDDATRHVGFKCRLDESGLYRPVTS